MISESLSLSTLIISLLLMTVCISTMRGNRARQILAVFFGLVALHSGFKYIGFSTTVFSGKALVYVVREITSVIIPQVIYLYVLVQLGIPVMRYQLFRTTVVPVAVLLLFFTFFIWSDGLSREVPFFNEAFYGIALLISVNYIVYVALSFRAIARHVRVGEDHLSPHTRVVLFWVRWLLGLLLFRAILALVIVPYLLFYVIPLMLQDVADTGAMPFGLVHVMPWLKVYLVIQSGAMLLATCLTAYYALRNPDLFDVIHDRPNLEQTLALAVVPGNHQQEIRRGLPDAEVMELAKRIRAVAEEKRLFLNPSLTARDVAEHTRIPQYKVTQALNKGLGKNFSEFINEYRIAHAKQLLTDPEHERLTILGIAQESGFASSAPFYSAFKKFTGLSPSEFRDSMSAGTNGKSQDSG